MKKLIILALCVFTTALSAANSSSSQQSGYTSTSSSTESGTGQQTIIEQPAPYPYPYNYVPPDSQINPGNAQVNDIYKSNQHR